ncbi:transcriptional regulator [Sphingobium lactosutens]|uniref:winged helix-turn-helix domain-containing tetratricopeptide repeat protein n=1 Tax=Sphingobium lactosutens TaxID=522773 RepID=UPI0015BE3A9A|nr:winged helix-turn-helix domain-containing protein [Sphingobium lactosutens]NWK96146.1 transcriptional regulator [Sphingobium lactosutens]
MIYLFDRFELDTARFELRDSGAVVHMEPQVLSLLALLVANADRMVSKDEIVEKIWNNRIISEAAVAARIKSARKAIGDDGQRQQLVRTIHGKGFRFVGEVGFAGPPATVSPIPAGRTAGPPHMMGDRPSIAVLPFRQIGASSDAAFLADALADELIADLARLRWLFVIARGSSFRFRHDQTDFPQLGRALGVRYCLTGSVTFSGNGISCLADLVETESGGIVWAGRYEDDVANIHAIRREILANMIAALEIGIAQNEAQRVRCQDMGQMSAWSAYHVGLDHMFRFNRADNDMAGRMFDLALGVNPDFARACAGKSFTHFQNAFLRYRADHASEAEVAQRLAERAVQLDRLDPFCHFNMGRSQWLNGDLDSSIDWLEQATRISPSYAQAVYSKAWAKTLAGAAVEGEENALLALALSPLDPLRYAMIATCALSRLIQGDYEQAASLAERAARSPGAHKHIAVIAAISTFMAGQAESARRWLLFIRQMEPDFSGRDFLRSFPFAPTSVRETIERALRDSGF